jgi:hypothetical protein
MSERVREIESFRATGRRTGRAHVVVHRVRETSVTTIHDKRIEWIVASEFFDTSDGQPVNLDGGQLSLAATGEPLDRV